MGIAGYVSVCVQLYYVGLNCLSLHVSAYMAIFKRVGIFIYLRILLGCFFGSLPFSHVITLSIFSVWWVKYQVLLFAVYAIFGTVICVFLLLLLLLLSHILHSSQIENMQSVTYTLEDGHVGRNM
jgi:hypothetical protein